MTIVNLNIRFESNHPIEELDALARTWLRYQHEGDIFEEREPGERFEEVVLDVIWNEVIRHEEAPIPGRITDSVVTIE